MLLLGFQGKLGEDKPQEAEAKPTPTGKVGAFQGASVWQGYCLSYEIFNTPPRSVGLLFRQL